MSETPSISAERQQIAALLRKVIVDEEFRNSFEADPRTAVAASGIAMSPEASEKLMKSLDLIPSVLAHMEGTEDIAKVFVFAKVIED